MPGLLFGLAVGWKGWQLARWWQGRRRDGPAALQRFREALERRWRSGRA
ncbi:hypothetical protein [Cyanobium sp. NIES-981]|nr:hypothetical protein [Cyanobium sp. NIES-981]